MPEVVVCFSWGKSPQNISEYRAKRDEQGAGIEQRILAVLLRNGAVIDSPSARSQIYRKDKT